MTRYLFHHDHVADPPGGAYFCRKHRFVFSADGACTDWVQSEPSYSTRTCPPVRLSTDVTRYLNAFGMPTAVLKSVRLANFVPPKITGGTVTDPPTNPVCSIFSSHSDGTWPVS